MSEQHISTNQAKYRKDYKATDTCVTKITL